jgi:hypothetical protein
VTVVTLGDKEWPRDRARVWDWDRDWDRSWDWDWDRSWGWGWDRVWSCLAFLWFAPRKPGPAVWLEVSIDEQ